MATLQNNTIPFKARKKTNYIKSKKDKDAIALKESNRILKREQYDNISSDEDDSCSPTKITKSNQCKPDIILTETKGDNEPQKTLTGRETEIAWLHNFLSGHLEKEQSASLYISGQPGTGKTASLSYLLQLPEIKNGYRHVYVNCTMMKSAASIYKRLCSELQLKTNGSTEKACLSAIEKYFSNKHKMTLIVLDEIDQLCNKKQSVLYSIFEWPSWVGSRLVLVGIANALNLVELHLPRLLARCSLKPEALHFAPYTKQQIVNIFENKIAQENKDITFSPAALQMIAAKISAISGDVRRALDVAKQVVGIAKRNQENVENAEKRTTVELRHVLEVLDNVYGNPKQIQDNMDEGIPIHQKLILCSLMLMLTKGKNKHITLSNLYDVYKRVAKNRNLSALDMSEYISACDLLQCVGALKVATNGKRLAPNFRKVTLEWNEAHLIGALRDRTFLSAVLDDVKCLAP